MAAMNADPSPRRWQASVTVAAVIARGQGAATEYLLVEEHTPEGLRLNNPAGHLERGESLPQAVVREALEECGRDFVPEAVLGLYLARFERPATGEDVTYLRVAFAGTVGEPRLGHVLDKAIVRTVWMDLHALRHSHVSHRSPLVLQCIEDHAAGVRHPLALLHGHPSLATPWRVG
jgi:8-oxo-dGTP pyrophosphatase MutT (NUDIX family)